MSLCAAVLAWQLFLPGFLGMADNGDFGKLAGPFCLGAADTAARDWVFFQPEYLRGSRFCYDPHLPMSEKALVWVASTVEQRLGDPLRFDIRWLGALHALLFLLFYYAVLRLLRPLDLVPRLIGSLAALWIFADIGTTAYFNTFLSDTSALLGGLAAIALAVPLLARKQPSPVLLVAFTAAAMLATLSKGQHAFFGLIPALVAVLSGRRARGWRTRAVAYGSAALLLLGVFYTLAATPKWYQGLSRFSLIFTKLTRDPATRTRDLRELGLEAGDARYAGMNAFMTGIPIEDAAWRERFYQRASFGRILRFYARHPGRAFAILQSDLRDEAWQRRPYSLSNYRKAAGSPLARWPAASARGASCACSFSAGGPAMCWLWFAVLLPGSLLFALREKEPLRRSLAWAVLGVSVLAIGEFGVASLTDAVQTSRHLFLFHIWTDCSFFLALVFGLSRFHAARRIERSRPALFAVLTGLTLAAALMVRLDGFAPPRTLAPRSEGGLTDDTSPRIAYSGHWDPGAFRGAFNGTVTYSETPGATARWQFEGTTFDYVYTKAFNRGFALVTVDGSERGTVDLYAPTIEWQASTEFGGLQPGRHTVEIRVLGSRNPASSGYFVYRRAGRPMRSRCYARDSGGVQPIVVVEGAGARHQLAGRRGDVAAGHPRHPRGLSARAHGGGGAALGGRSLRSRKLHRPRHSVPRPEAWRAARLRRRACARSVSTPPFCCRTPSTPR